MTSRRRWRNLPCLRVQFVDDQFVFGVVEQQRQTVDVSVGGGVMDRAQSESVLENANFRSVPQQHLHAVGVTVLGGKNQGRIAPCRFHVDIGKVRDYLAQYLQIAIARLSRKKIFRLSLQFLKQIKK